MTKPRILLVEDELHLAENLTLNLELDGFEVMLATTALAAQECLHENAFELMIFDRMLPDGDGRDLCAYVRSQRILTPVLILTARAQSQDKVDGLNAGADDYLTKPFELQELLARVRSLLRRQAWQELPTQHTEHFNFGQARISPSTHQAWMNNAPVELTALELKLLQHLYHNPNQVLSRQNLLNEVWGLSNYQQTRTIDNFILRLRKHFEPDPANPVHFRSVRGRGYMFCP